jgi:hypothetical protein
MTAWWYCLKHDRVEEDHGCASTDRMGPYASPADAQRALTTAAEKTEAWEHDPRWEDED